MFTCVFLPALLFGLVAFALFWFVLWIWLRGPDLSQFDRPDVVRVTAREKASPEIARVHEVLAKLRSKTGPLGSRGRLQRVRAAFDEGFGEGDRDGQSLGVEIVPCDAKGVAAEWILPPQADPKRRLLYLHGGAFYLGSPRSHRPLTAGLARRTGAAVLAIDYRLMPENSRRAGIEDCQSGYRYVLEHGPHGAADPERIYVAGDSAGGNLTLMLSAWARDEGLRAADAVLALSPATDATLSSPTIRGNLRTDPLLGPVFRPIAFLPRTLLRFWTLVGLRMHPANPLVSPLLGDLSGLPPTLVQASESELLLGDAARYVNRARAAESPVELQTWPGMVHVWQIFDGQLPEAGEALDEMARFVARQS